MKKSILILFAMSMVMFAESNGIKRVHEQTTKLKNDSYCNIPKNHSEFKKINDKDYRVDIDFEKCVLDGETYNDVKVGVLIQNIEKTEKYLKKYKYMHLKAGRNLVYDSKNNIYYHDGSWAFNNDKAYPTVFDGK